mgnify:CR=1 FL=1
MRNIALAVILALFAAPSWSCECAEWEDARTMFDAADAIFVGTPGRGKVVKIDEYGQTILENDFRVTLPIKRVVGPRVALRSHKDDGGNCGTAFRKGRGRWLVFAYLQDGFLQTDSCSIANMSTSKIAQFVTELEVVGRSHP